MDTSMIKNVRIGDVLKEYGYVTDEQINQAMQYQKEHRGVRLGGALIELGMISEKQMLGALGKRLQLQSVDLRSIRVETEAVEKIPKQLAEQYGMLGFHLENNKLQVAMNDPMNFYGIEDVRQATGMDLEIQLCEKAELIRAISYHYSELAAKNAAHRANESFHQEAIEEIQVEEGDDDTPIINLLRSLVEKAYSINASDIHVEPYEENTLIRMRVDGAIMDYVTLQKSVHNSLIARIKILSDMDIAERRVPQDGHFQYRLGTERFNIRVSVIPTVYGEKAVLRLLSNTSVIDHQECFGMVQDDYEKFQKMLKSPHGIIYLTGPTGSGKSTTLYMVLEEMAKKNLNISTIEDPVEKNVAKLNQMQVNQMAGLTFERGLRALLRQDPDIIMVGETRDSETASISVRAAITGHLVFSTLHTNDAVSTIVRLEDMGLEPYIVANSLIGSVAQRLMRKVCPYCAEAVEMTSEEEQFVGRRLHGLKKGKGCPRCNNTGYHGRTAIHEILVIDQQVRKMITEGSPVDDIKQYAVEHLGMKSLKESGIELVERGETTIEELVKVAYYS